MLLFLQAADIDDRSAEVRQPDNICNTENAEDLEQDCKESENGSKQIVGIAKQDEEIADEVNDDQSVISYLDEDETLIQEVEKSDMVEEAQGSEAGEVGSISRVKAPCDDQVRMTSASLTEDPGQGERLSRRSADEAAENLNDTRENVGYVSIVDRMLGMSAKPSQPQKYAAEQDKDPKEIPKREKKEVCIIVEPDTRNEVELSPQQVGLKVAMDRVLREKSAAKEMSVPRCTIAIIVIFTFLLSGSLPLSCLTSPRPMSRRSSNAAARILLQGAIQLQKKHHQPKVDLTA